MARLLLIAASILALVAGLLVPAIPAAAEPTGPAVPRAASVGTVLINELANGDASSDSNSFAELRNWGAEPVDLTGWRLFRCSEQGLRSNAGRIESDLTGVVLEPGALFVVSRVGMRGDRQVSQPYGLTGFGLYLEAPGGALADAVGVYPNEPWPLQSECTPPGGNLPNVLDFARSESWQRVAATGDPARDFLVAPSTLGAANASRAEPRAAASVVIAELSSAGPRGPQDEFVELLNDGAATVEIGGWTLWRCSAEGRQRSTSRAFVVPDGVDLAPGERFVVGGSGFTGAADAALAGTLDDVEFGMQLRTDTERLVDRVAVSAHGDSACQDPGAKLPAVLDAVGAESWQRATSSDSGDGEDSGWLIARRTPDQANALRDTALFHRQFAYPQAPGVAISEVATDPVTDGMPDGSIQRNWIELGNYGAEPVELGGWSVRRCQVDGTRALAPQFTIPLGTVLAPGDVYLAARSGTPEAANADASYDVALNFLGTGVWLSDAAGRRVDSVGIYAANEMDIDNVTASPCTKGVALTTYQPDRLLAETFQRSRFTGVDADDFVTGPATPGELDAIPWVEPTSRVTGVSMPDEDVHRPERALAPRSSAGADATADPAVVLEAWSGVSEGGPLDAERGSVERRLDLDHPLEVSDDGYDFPYLRLVLDASDLAAGSTVGWTGTTEPRHELRLSAWSGSAWRQLATATGDPTSGAVTLRGELAPEELRDGRVTLLVQDGPRTQPTLSSELDGRFADPGAYDLAISHITDTQYLTESYPEVYAELVSWIADNAPGRKIAFATHTGDVVQNWVDPAQSEQRARREFERASQIQAILEYAGVANSVLPGNHDNKRGVDDDLFNEFFPPSRYEGNGAYAGSIAPDDNSANYSTFERAGARFLMLSLPYAYGDRELEWAAEVVAEHPDHNVILSTHEHVTPKTADASAGRAAASRWTSRAQDLWDRVIAPNRNVVLVLAGHFHGLGKLTTENAGGIPGHTVVELLADYQEFRTHTGERATGFQRLLQLDLASGTVAVDTFSAHLGASASFEYDYRQFVPENGSVTAPSNARPWRIVAAGLQGRYGAEDDEFTASVAFQYAKSVATDSVTVSTPQPAIRASGTRASGRPPVV